MASEAEKDIVAWINRILSLDFKKLCDVNASVVSLQIMELVHPRIVLMRRVIEGAKTSIEKESNFKLLQEVFFKLKIDKEVEIHRLIQGKSSDILELLQFLKCHYDSFYKGKGKIVEHDDGVSPATPSPSLDVSNELLLKVTALSTRINSYPSLEIIEELLRKVTELGEHINSFPENVSVDVLFKKISDKIDANPQQHATEELLGKIIELIEKIQPSQNVMDELLKKVNELVNIIPSPQHVAVSDLTKKIDELLENMHLLQNDMKKSIIDINKKIDFFTDKALQSFGDLSKDIISINQKIDRSIAAPVPPVPLHRRYIEGGSAMLNIALTGVNVASAAILFQHNHSKLATMQIGSSVVSTLIAIINLVLLFLNSGDTAP